MAGCGRARAHLVFAALIHLSPSGSISSGGRVSNGKELHIHRSSTGLGAHTGACWEPRLPWEQPRVPLYLPLIFLYCDIHKMSAVILSGRRTLPTQCLQGPHLNSRTTYLCDLWIFNLWSIMQEYYYTRLYTDTGIWGKTAGKVEKPEMFKSLDVRGFTHPYSLMRARVKQAPVVRLHGSGFCTCFLFVALMI